MSRSSAETPPLLILFINSTCNLTCEHCFYWKNLNSRDDLSFEEIRSLSAELGPVDNLNLSGGEPFLRDELAEVCSLFADNNGTRLFYVPSSGYFTERTERQVRQLLANPRISQFTVELSLDGTADYHDRFRGNRHSFEHAMETYDMLAGLRRERPALRIHAISTATHENMGEIRGLTEFLHDRCPAMDHHNLAVIRGDRKNPGLAGPELERYASLYHHVATVWRDRERGRFGSSVEPMLQWAKCRTLATDRQFVACTAGVMTGVVYANGDVSLCETHPPIGNLRQHSFRHLWGSPEAQALRQQIAARQCHCTNEVFLWPSIVYQPGELARAMVGSWLWRPGSGPTSSSGRNPAVIPDPGA